MNRQISMIIPMLINKYLFIDISHKKKKKTLTKTHPQAIKWA